MVEYLSENEATRLVESYMDKDDEIVNVQDLLDSGDIPRLKGYHIRPGKVSDSIFGGYFEYHDKGQDKIVNYDNDPLMTKEGVPMRIMVRTPRISTHDMNRGEIPFKDQILAMNHNYMLRMVSDVMGSSQFEVEGLQDNSIVIAAENLAQIPFENVLRAYMAKSTTETSLFQHYIHGKRVFCGHELPNDLVSNGKLPYVMDTPSTKSDKHDESVSPEEMIGSRCCTFEQYLNIRNNSLVAFGIATKYFGDRGLILVDTKTEHGINHRSEIVVQDEVYTMDSSRFWLADDYNEQVRQTNNGLNGDINPKSFSKEFARGFSKGTEGYTDEQRIQIAVRYILGIQELLGIRFEPDLRSHKERIVSGLEAVEGIAA